MFWTMTASKLVFLSMLLLAPIISDFEPALTHNFPYNKLKFSRWKILLHNIIKFIVLKIMNIDYQNSYVKPGCIVPIAFVYNLQKEVTLHVNWKM